MKKVGKIWMCTLLKLYVLANTAFATTYFVDATLGNDNNSGTSTTAAWRTLNKVNNYNFSPGDSILFKRGQTWFGQLTISSSGTAGNLIVYSAYGSGQQPVISGAKEVSGWIAIGNGLYETTVPEAGRSVFVCTVDGKNQKLGRWPKHSGADGGWLFMDFGSGNTITDQDVPASRIDWTGAELVDKPYPWIIQRADIVSHVGNTFTLNHDRFIVAPDYEGRMGVRTGAGFFIQNHPAACTELGDWCYRADTRKLTMFFGHNNPANHSVSVGAVDVAIDLTNQSYITLKNLTVFGANRKAIEVEQTKHVTLDEMLIDASGKDGISGNVMSYLTVTKSTISNSNNNSFQLGNFNTLPASNVTLKNNIITNTAINPGMGGNGDFVHQAIEINGHNMVISGNTIDNVGYNGLRFSGDAALIENNIITKFCQLKDDGGGIYTIDRLGGGSFQRISKNRIIRANIISNSGTGVNTGNGGGASSTAGIYLDNNTNHVLIEDNTIFNCSEGIFLHDNDNISVVNNTLYNNRDKQLTILHDEMGLLKDMDNINIIGNKMIGLKPRQEVMYVSTLYGANEIKKWNFNNNYYNAAIGQDADLIRTYDKHYSLSLWRETFGLDLNSSTGALHLKEYVINSYKSGNKFSNKGFDRDIDGANCFATTGGICSTSWDNSSKLDGGALKVDFQNPANGTTYTGGGTFSTGVDFGIGAVHSGQKFLFKFSQIGSKAGEVLVNLKAKRGAVNNWFAAEGHQFAVTTTSRTEQEYLFTADGYGSDTQIPLTLLNQADAPFWIDNVEVYEVDASYTIPSEHFFFYYNSSAVPITINLPSATLKDVANDRYSGQVVLQPFQSIVLMKDGTTVLSQKFSSVRSNCNNNTITINWEIDNKYSSFEIQKSNDGVTWEKAGSTTSRSFSDNSPFKFYRVNARGTNQNTVTSSVTKSPCSTIGSSFKVYPNPVQDHCNITFRSYKVEQVKLKLYNSIGGLVKVIDTKVSTGINTITINMSGLAAGLYQLANDFGNVLKIVKE